MFINRIGANHHGKHSAKRPRTEVRVEPELLKGTRLSVPGGFKTPVCAVPRGLENAGRIDAGLLKVNKKDRRRGVVERRFILLSV